MIAPASIGLALLAMTALSMGFRGLPIRAAKGGYFTAAFWFCLAIVLNGVTNLVGVAIPADAVPWIAFFSVTSFATGAFFAFKVVLDLVQVVK